MGVNLNSIDLNLLVVFNAVYRTRSTTRAGEELNVTQSAVSNALRRMRDVVGEPLFQRTARGVVPTEAALRIAGPVQESLARLQDALAEPKRFEPRRAQRTFRFYVSDAGQLVALPRLLSELRSRAPLVKVETIATSPREARALMQDGEVDLAFGHFDGFDEGFFREPLFQERYVCLVRGDHPAIRRRITLEQFFDSAHAVYRPTAGSHAFFEARVDQLFAAHSRTRNVTLRLSHGLGIAEIVRRTDLLACVPSRLAAELVRGGGLRVLPAPFRSPTFDIALYWPAHRQRDSAHAWLRRLFRSLFAEKEKGS
jgi:DNA-binding transcriptional LysR family regulator